MQNFSLGFLFHRWVFAQNASQFGEVCSDKLKTWNVEEQIPGPARIQLRGSDGNSWKYSTSLIAERIGKHKFSHSALTGVVCLLM